MYPSGIPAQLLAFVLGGCVYVGAYSLPFSFWKRVAPFLFISIVLALLFTLVLGKTTKGSTRWIAFGSMQIQPSQLAKPILILYFCTYLGLLYEYQKNKKLQHAYTNIATHIAYAATPIALVFLQPDLGTALILMVGYGASLYFSHIPLKVFGILILAGVLIGGFGWSYILKDYQKQRLTSYLAPTEGQLEEGYQASQAMIAVGSGKVLGRGLGHGVQSGLRFLPERQTDFMFASYAEELGFVGVAMLYVLYGIFFTLLILLTSRVKDSTGYAYAWAFIAHLFAQTAMNVGMNLGMLPIAGVTLPLMSLGGSSVIAICFGLGLLVSAYRANPKRHLVEIHSFV